MLSESFAVNFKDQVRFVSTIGSSMLILSLLVSNLIIVYILIVASSCYVEKLAPVDQSYVFKCWTVIALK